MSDRVSITGPSSGSGGPVSVGDLPNNIPATKIADGSVNDAEFQGLNTVVSNVQTQLDQNKSDSWANSVIASAFS